MSLDTTTCIATRLFQFNLLEYVKGVWDSNTPVINHAVLEAVGVSANMVEGLKLESNLVKYCKELDLTVVNVFNHKFKPYGSTCLIVLAESHLAVHSWPENNYLHMDLVTCTKGGLDQYKVVSSFKKIFDTKSVRVINFIY